MYNILDFIDSESIREYNRDTVFTPAQQAIIAIQSRNKSICDKIQFLEELVSIHKEEDFTLDGIYEYDCRKPFRVSILNTVKAYEEALNDFNEYIYACCVVERGSSDNSIDDYSFFKSFEAAYNFLSEQYKELENDTEIYGKILRICDKDCSCIESFHYNHSLKLFRINTFDWRFDDEGDVLDIAQTFIKLPFEKGDIVVSIRPDCEMEIGIFTEDLTSENFGLRGADGVIFLYTCKKDDSNSRWYFDDIEVSTLSLCHFTSKYSKYFDKSRVSILETLSCIEKNNDMEKMRTLLYRITHDQDITNL